MGRIQITCLFLCVISVVKSAVAATPTVKPAAPGRVLLGDLNCASCHAASPTQARWITTKVAPRLTDVGTRLYPEWVTRYLAAPHDVHAGVTMPDVLRRLPEGKRSAAAEAITHFLYSTSAPVAKAAYPDRAAAKRGEALYQKVGCVACHAPQDGSGSPASSVPLPKMAEKWSFAALRNFLRDPLACRPSGRMPSMNLTDGEAADVAHYLLRETKVAAPLDVAVCRGPIRSWDDLEKSEPVRTMPADAFAVDVMGRERGYALRFTGYVRVELPGEYTLHLNAVGASRLGVDGKWLIGKDGASGQRIDDQAKVTLDAGLHAIAVDFVQRGPKEPSLEVTWAGPGLRKGTIGRDRLQNAREAIPGPAKFIVDPAKAERGRGLYAELNCAACHEAKLPATPLPPMAALDVTRGCLAETVGGAAPDFHLTANAREAIRAAVEFLRAKDLSDPTPSQKLAHSLATFRCTACHRRDGAGGVPADRDTYFTSGGEDLGDEGRLPPRLESVGNKLTPDALLAVLTKGAAVRPYLNTRMPQFGEANVGGLAAVFVTLDRKPVAVKASPDTPDVQREAGRKIVGTDGVSCIACHRFNRQPAQALQVVDLITVTTRLNEDWFRQFLIDPNKFHPGTRMPTFWPDGESVLPMVLGGNTDRQQAALWTYLSDGPRAKFPAGLGRQNVELVVGGETVVYRGKLWEAGFRGIAVGYPGGLNASFDAEECRLSLLWRGRFLNAGPHWTVQGMGQIRPLGTDVVVFGHGSPYAVLTDVNETWPTAPSRELGLRFGGYQLDAQKRPTFLMSFGGRKIEDATSVVEGEKPALRRTITFVDPPVERLYFRLAEGKVVPVGKNAWRVNDQITVTLKSGGEAVLRGLGEERELVVRVPTGEGQRRLEVEYAW